MGEAFYCTGPLYHWNIFLLIYIYIYLYILNKILIIYIIVILKFKIKVKEKRGKKYFMNNFEQMLYYNLLLVLTFKYMLN